MLKSNIISDQYSIHKIDVYEVSCCDEGSTPSKSTAARQNDFIRFNNVKHRGVYGRFYISLFIWA